VSAPKEGKKDKMKIVFSTSGDNLDAPLDGRFGRAPKFLVYDLETDACEVVDNLQNLQAAQGAGVQAASTVARLGAAAVVTGHCGPKAFRVLSSAGIKVYTCAAPTVGAALALYREGKLLEAQAADVEGHWA
jgi:predicted Fe-Mo cluster-binding NifX family protein